MEEWKAIGGFDGYMVSSNGTVKGLKTKVMKGAKNQGGYLTVLLCSADGHKRRLIHRLVAEAFIPNPENKPEIDHIDRNKNNNSVNNLRWVTRSENILNRPSRTNEAYIRQYIKVCVPGHKERCFDTMEDAIKYRDSLLG